MVKFVARRLLLAIPVVWAAVTLLFAIFFVLPGDRVDAVAAGNRTLTPTAKANINHQLGLDRPLLVQYGKFWARLGHGDLGRSFVTDRPVVATVKTAAPASLRLALWALTIEVVVGITLGALAAVGKGRVLAGWTTVWTALFLALPIFVVGIGLQLALGVHPFQAGWPHWLRFPVQGIGPNHWWIGVIPANDQWRYLLLPAVSLAFVSTAIVTRLTRASLSSVMAASFIRGARARGIRESRVFLRHGLRNALIPTLTFVGLDFVSLFGSAVITESIFNWPGLGNVTADALEHQDAPVILGVTVVLAVVYVVVNLLVDALYARLDPRLGSRS